MMQVFDPTSVVLGPQQPRPSVLRDYLQLVAHDALTEYKNLRQYGAKKGESLYTHILNGIFLLEAIRELMDLSDVETRLLFTVFTIHDINKDPDYEGQHFNRIAIPTNFQRQVQKLGLDRFFPEYERYLDEITNLASRHGGHSGGLSLAARPSSILERQELERLLMLIRAVDVVDLSQSLEEPKHKHSFLSYFNGVLDDRQYDFYLHQLVEDRGVLSNIVHNAIIQTLQEQGLTPLLFYTDGVAYLIPKGETAQLGQEQRRKMVRRAANAINEMVSRDYMDFIRSGIQGIKVDPKCLELGIPFNKIWEGIYTRVQSRNLNRDQLLEKVVERIERNLERHGTASDEAAAAMRQRLQNAETELLPSSTERLRDAEMIRSYYIFLNSHFTATIPDAWEHIYNLFNVPEPVRRQLEFCDPRWDRPYVLIGELEQGHEAIYDLIETDGSALLETHEAPDDKVELFQTYLERYCLFGPLGNLRPAAGADFGDHLQEYVNSQHRQCVHCSSIFATERWMTNDVRSDIKVQTFSNRLRGGPGEPKKFICSLCQLQFLVERLNYEEVRNEKTVYLHLFPYSFLPAPFIHAMRRNIDGLRRQDTPLRTLWCDTAAQLRNGQGGEIRFAIETRTGKPHSFGLYVHNSPSTIGNRLIFPLNPGGDTDSERFLFTLWYAIVLQQHFGLRVLLSNSPVAPFELENDLYIDNTALSARGLVTRNDYDWYLDPKKKTPGPLQALHKQARALHQIERIVQIPRGRSAMLALVEALAHSPLQLIYVAEKLLEARVREEQRGGSAEWKLIRYSRQLLVPLETIVKSKGGDTMAKLSEHLQSLAQIAWQGGLRGKSLKKNSLIMPLDEIFNKLNLGSQAFDDEALKAAIAQDIFEYLERIAEEYKPGRRKMEAATQFVEDFFTNIYHGAYKANRTRLLADEKLLRSAYMFYIRQQIPVKQEISGDE